MTKDFWENLLHMIVRAAGPWHIIYFLFILFIFAFYLVAMIWANIALSYTVMGNTCEGELQNAAHKVRNYIPNNN